MIREKTMLVHYCDICGREISGKIYSPVWGELDPDGSFDKDGDIIAIDICKNCIAEADQMIRDLFEKKEEVKVVEDTEPGLAQELAQKKGHSRRKIDVDMGKLRALYEAGWSEAKIADEMNISRSTVYRNIKVLKEEEK